MHIFQVAFQTFVFISKFDDMLCIIFTFGNFILGQFTLRDMYEQFQNIMKMGPFSQIMVGGSIFFILSYCDSGIPAQ